MIMIKGIRVKLINLIDTGERDPFGKEIYQEKIVYVDDVLVSSQTADDLVNADDLKGKKEVYLLGIPKGDQNVWENQYVEFFGKRFHVFSPVIQGIDEMIPLRWNKKVYVERYS